MLLFPRSKHHASNFIIDVVLGSKDPRFFCYTETGTSYQCFLVLSLKRFRNFTDVRPAIFWVSFYFILYIWMIPVIFASKLPAGVLSVSPTKWRALSVGVCASIQGLKKTFVFNSHNHRRYSPSIFSSWSSLYSNVLGLPYHLKISIA